MNTFFISRRRFSSCPGNGSADQAGLELKWSACLCLLSAEFKDVSHHHEANTIFWVMHMWFCVDGVVNMDIYRDHRVLWITCDFDHTESRIYKLQFLSDLMLVTTESVSPFITVFILFISEYTLNLKSNLNGAMERALHFRFLLKQNFQLGSKLWAQVFKATKRAVCQPTVFPFMGCGDSIITGTH